MNAIRSVIFVATALLACGGCQSKSAIGASCVVGMPSDATFTVEGSVDGVIHGCGTSDGGAGGGSGTGGGTANGGGGGTANGGGGGSAAGGGGTGGGSGATTAVKPIDHNTATIYSVYPQIYSAAGNFAAVTSDLARIHDLGFDTLYLLPVTPLGVATGAHPAFGSPYCVHDYKAINPAFGTSQDLITLVQTAHGLGMHVILDEVLNHTAWDNDLITSHPEYYVHSDGNPANSASIVQATGFADVAQLDYKTPTNGLAAYMEDMLTYWVQTYDVDGFRFDTADNPYGDTRLITLDFWKALRAKLLAAKPGLFLLGEAEDPDLIDSAFDLDYGWHMDGIYDTGLQQVAAGADASNMQRTWTYQKTGYPTDTRHMALLQDWDTDEDLKIYGGVPNTMAAAVYDFTIDGLPMLFNGEDVGNDNSAVNTHTAINWKSPNAASFTAFYKSLLALRNASSALQQGSVMWLTNSQSAHVVSFSRSDGSGTFVIVINFSNAALTGTLTGTPNATSWQDVSPVGSPGGTTHPAPPAFSLGAYDFAVFKAK
jgi:cyclomaltodextrinase